MGIPFKQLEGVGRMNLWCKVLGDGTKSKVSFRDRYMVIYDSGWDRAEAVFSREKWRAGYLHSRKRGKGGIESAA